MAMPTVKYKPTVTTGGTKTPPLAGQPDMYGLPPVNKIKMPPLQNAPTQIQPTQTRPQPTFAGINQPNAGVSGGGATPTTPTSITSMNPHGGTMPPITYRPDVPTQQNIVPNGAGAGINGRPTPNPSPNPVNDPRYLGGPPSSANPGGIVNDPRYLGGPPPNPVGGGLNGHPPPQIGPTPNPPPDPTRQDINAIRQGETLPERIARLQAMQATNPNDNRAARIARTQAQIDAGKIGHGGNPPVTPNGAGAGINPGNGGNGNGGSVQLDNDPSTWHLGDLAELAPPPGTNTRFDDVGKSAALQARKQKIKAKAQGAGTTPVKNKAAKKAAKAATKTTTNLTKKNESANLTAKQKANLKKRPQPGTPNRPYISRGVTYSPLGEGGKLRV